MQRLRMGAAEDAIEEEVRAMRASQIKKILGEMSVATKGLYEVRLQQQCNIIMCGQLVMADTGAVELEMMRQAPCT